MTTFLEIFNYRRFIVVLGLQKLKDLLSLICSVKRTTLRKIKSDPAGGVRRRSHFNVTTTKYWCEIEMTKVLIKINKS